MKSVQEMSAKELEALLAEKRKEEHEMQIKRREAYEAIRAELLMATEAKVRDVSANVLGLYDFCVNELGAFRKTMAEYGRLRNEGQMSYKIEEGNFKIEVKTNKVKKFDERADVAAARLIEFLQGWIKGKEDGANNPMYQLAMTLLERNRQGDLDYKSISKLYELEDQFSDPEYSDIMSLFKESHLVEGTATNFYFSERTELGVWRKIEINFNRL